MAIKKKSTRKHIKIYSYIVIDYYTFLQEQKNAVAKPNDKDFFFKLYICYSYGICA